MTIVGTAVSRLPDGFVVRLRGDVHRADGGRVLVGGSPLRAVRMSALAHELFDGDRLIVTGSSTAGLARRLLDGNLADPVPERSEPRPEELTVVVPVRDRVEQLARCLSALSPLKVVVVDDASGDAAAISNVASQHGATVVRLERNVGPAGARNRGLAQVTTPFVAFVDSDVVVGSAGLLDLAGHCADPAVALVGPRVIGEPRGTRPRWFERYDMAASSLDLGRTGGQVRPGSAIGWLPSACLVGRVAPLVPGFDPTMRVGEDVDLVWRLAAAGWAVRYDPSVIARHDVRTTVRSWLARKFVYGTGGADLAARHGDSVAPAILSPVMAIAAAAVLQRRWWSVPVIAAAIATSTHTLRKRVPVTNRRSALAARLSLRGLGWAVRQESALLLRHWWPIAAVAATAIPSVRRAVVTAIAVDVICFQRERPGVELLTVVGARRLDDLAYGAGLWWGAARRGSARCLLVRRPVKRPISRTAAPSTFA